MDSQPWSQAPRLREATERATSWHPLLEFRFNAGLFHLELRELHFELLLQLLPNFGQS